jgi:hypothetical protein
MPRHDEYYKSFGTTVLETVRSHMRVDGTIPDLLKRLNLPVSVEVDAQHATLSKFIYQYGISFFLNAVREAGSGDDIERMKAQRFMDSTGGSLRSGIVVSQNPVTPAHSQPVQPPPVQPPQWLQQQWQQWGPPQWQQPPGFVPPHAPSPAALPQPQAAWIKTADYEGPDRRSGVERRVGPADRRLQLDVVYKNRRFGGRDRRKTVRRAEDRKKQGIE